MAKKNVRNVLRKTELPGVSINPLQNGLPEYKMPNAFVQADANKDPELIPHCFSSFCYLGLCVWLLLNKNYNLLYDRGSAIVVAACYAVEFAKFAIHTYLMGKLSNGHRMKPKASPFFRAFQFVASTAISVCAAYLFAILFGAAVFTKQEQTFVFSMLVTAVIITPTVVVQLGSNILPLLLTDCLESEFASTIEVYEKNNFQATILGAFIGSAVIPLDWNAEWQRWPIPCCIGLLGGHLLANVYEIICWQFKSLKNHSIKKNKC